MAKLTWDRLLETCNNRGTDILLTAGSKPLIRIPDSWRTLETNVLQTEDIRHMANELLEQRQPDGTWDGCAYFTAHYGENHAYFRIFAFGFPQTNMLMISRCLSKPSGGAAS